MKILNKKILNKAATFLLTAVLLCWNAVQVEAYTDLNGYPFVMENFKFGFYVDNMSTSGSNSFIGILSEQNSYLFDVNFNPDIYDYYFIGSLYFVGDNTGFENIKINSLFFEHFYDSEFFFNEMSDFTLLDFDSLSPGCGKSFYGKMNVGDFGNFSTFRMNISIQDFIIDDVWFSASIVPVAKGSEAEQLNQSILNELIKINQNLVTSNSLQQSTIDAINQHDANEKSWFQQLIQNMGLGFSALYEQMKKEQDEQLEQNSEQHDEVINGFDASGGNSASGNLGNSLDSMEEVESGITDKAFEGMNEYTIPEEGVTGYAQQFLTTFPLVAAMMQSIYDSSGPFNILLSVTFTFVLVSMLIGLYRFYKD